MSVATDLSSPSSNPAYRPDIDGLRAIAVLSVVVFHAFPTLLPGGFVGVDIFFVLSGYLITSILQRGLENGSFGFADFYSRRVRRIFPVLLLVLVACLVAGWQVLLANEYAQLGRHIAAGAGFLSNFALWAESGYFDTASDAKPLLHLWSLGIEEQFYIAWPLLMWGAYKLHIRFYWMACSVLLVSFAWNIGSVGTDPVSAFYMPHSRIWELLVGAVLATAFLQPGFSHLLNTSRKYKNQAAILGLVLLLIAISALSKASLFPGWWALLPVVGAALLIYAEGSWINSNILSHRVLVRFGLISYPLYLLHWPLLSFGRIVRNGELSVGERLGLMLFAVVLAFLTYRYCERYLRHQGNKVAAALFLSMCIVGSLGWNVYVREGLDFRYWGILKQPPEMVRDFTKWVDKDMYPTGVCDPDFIYPNARICLQSQSNSKPDTVVFGDSHAFHAYWGIAKSMGGGEHTVKLVGRGGCAFFIYRNDSDCEQTFERQVQWMIENPTVQNIFVVHRNPIQNTSSAEDIADYRNRTDSLFDRLAKSKKQVVYLYSVPEARMNPELCGSVLPFGRKADLASCNFPLSRELGIQRTYREIIANLIKKYPEIQVFDPAEILCEGGSCKTISRGKPVWMDNNHISESASYVQGEAITRAFSLR